MVLATAPTPLPKVLPSKGGEPIIVDNARLFPLDAPGHLQD
jgi:hypothetical protein